MLSPCILVVDWSRAGLSIFNAKSLYPGSGLIESRTQHLLCWVTELWRGLGGEPDSEFPMLSHRLWRNLCGELWEAKWGVRLSILQNILSLCAGYIVIRGRLSKSFLSLWSGLSCPYTESPLLCTYRRRSQTQLVLLSHCSSGSEIPCWVEGGSQEEYQLSKPLLSWWEPSSISCEPSCVNQTRHSVICRVSQLSGSQAQNSDVELAVRVEIRFSSVSAEPRD